MLIAIDFDGTVVQHKYPKIGKEIPFATATLKQLIRDGHRLILWTSRTGQLLEDALEWCHEKGVEFYAVNKDYPEEEEHCNEPRKIKVDMYIDDRNVGGLPGWGIIYQLISQKITLQEFLLKNVQQQAMAPKKHWWQ